ncbi:MAG: MOSC domain-containing protein, partial [bacterium]
WKEPVDGPVRVGRLNLDGDRQSDLTVHGGAEKAVYGYPDEHYEFWRAELGDATLAHGAFGENLTTSGLDESSLRIGDRLEIGTAEFRVTQPRMPCFKLGIRHGRPGILRTFLASGRSGFYLSVLTEGVITAGDAIQHRPLPESSLNVSDIVRLYTGESHDQEMLRRAVELPHLAAVWREVFRKRLANGPSR